MHDLEQSRLGIAAHTLRRDHPVVPVITAYQAIEPERITGPRGQHHTIAGPLHD